MKLKLFLGAAIVAALSSLAQTTTTTIASVGALNTVGVNLVADTTNKVMIVQNVPSPGAAPVQIASFDPHTITSVSFSWSNGSGGIAGVIASTVNGQLVYRITDGNAVNDKFCSTANPLPTGAVACAALPF